MSQFFKRIIRLMAVVMLVITITAMFVGCGSNRDYDWKIVDVTDDSVPEEYDVNCGKGATVSYSGPDNWYAPASLSKGLEVWKEVEKRMNIKMKWQVLPSAQWNISMMTKINGGSVLPDIMGLPNWHSADIDRFAREKVIIPLNELINKYAPNIKRILKENPEYRKTITAPDGGIYSIDDYFGASEYYYTVAIRKDWLQRLGLSVPVTIADYENVMQAFLTLDANGNGETDDEIPLYASGGYLYDYFCSGFGLSAPIQDSVAVSNGKVVYQRATPEYGEFLGWLNKCYDNKWMDARYEAGNSTAFEAEVSRNTVGITIAPGDLVDKYNKQLRKSGNTDAEYILINPPVDKNGKLTLVKREITGGQVGISIDCKDPILAIRFLDYLWGSEAGNTLLQYGIEGKTYTLEEGKPKLTEWVMNNPDGLDPGSALRTVGAWGPLLDRQTKDFMKSFYQPQAIEYYEKNITDGLYVNSFPKMLPTKAEVDAMSKLSNEIHTYQSETSLKYILGKLPISEYTTKYIPKLEQMGIRSYEVLRGEQYSRFMAS